MMENWKIKLLDYRAVLIKQLFNSVNFLVKNDSNEKYLEIELKGGLNNKLFCLFSACDIAIKNKSILVEPQFGWKKKILFSDIYDIDYFNEKMKDYNGGNNLMIARKHIRFNLRIINSIKKNRINLWKYSEDVLEGQRASNKMSKDSMNILVLKALKLKKKHLDMVEKYAVNKNFTAIQIRTESDWVLHAEHTMIEKGEILLVNIDKLIKMVSKLEFVEKVFFTSGENHENLLKAFNEYNYEADFFYNTNYEYEINAAVNFEICCQAKYFIGLSRSTFSNLISLKRALLNNDNSYIYNLDNKIYRRIDKGLQPVARHSILYCTDID